MIEDLYKPKTIKFPRVQRIDIKLMLTLTLQKRNMCLLYFFKEAKVKMCSDARNYFIM